MEPTLRDSDKVLAEIVNRANWPEIVGPVAVLVYSKITVGRVVKNDLTDHSTITLIPDNELCQSSTFNDLDIIDMWSIIEIISAKVL